MYWAFRRFNSSAVIVIIKLKEETNFIAAKNLHFHQNQSNQHASHAY
jgi:hypothetical protein